MVMHGGQYQNRHRQHGVDLRTTVKTYHQPMGRVSTRTTMMPSRTTRPAQSESNRRRMQQQRGGGRSDEMAKLIPDVLVHPQTLAKYFRTHEKLGEGGFSVCYLVEDEEGTLMAGKFFTRKASSSRKRLERFEREVKMMQTLDHANIVKCYDAMSGVKDNRPLSDFKSGDHVSYHHPPVMMLEYCSGTSLSTFLKSRADHRRHPNRKYGKLSEAETLWVAECTARALVYLKEKRILHRDIKLGNLLLQHPVNRHGSLVNAGIVLCDFGLATQLGEDEHLAYGTAGTPYYIAREVIMHEGASFESDIWSLGVTLFYCLTGRAPFFSKSGRSTSGIYRKIRRGDYRWRSRERESISRGMRHLVQDMLEEDPEDRPTPEELLQRIHEKKE